MDLIYEEESFAIRGAVFEVHRFISLRRLVEDFEADIERI